MELRQLTYFCRACELGSITAAASDLFVAEQTISASIAKLEHELGVSLLVRSKSGVKPTSAGGLTYLKASMLLRQADDLIASIKPQETNSLIRFVYTTDSIGAELSMSDVDDFQVQNPGVTIIAFEYPCSLCQKSLLDGSADIALVVGEPDPSLFTSELVMEGHVVMALPVGHRLASNSELSIGDLRDEPILIPPDTEYGLPHLIDACHKHGFEPHLVPVPQRQYFDSAAEGKGFALIPVGHPMALGRDDIAVLPLAAEDDFCIPIWFALKKGVPVQPWVANFESFMLDRWRKTGD